MGFVGVARHYHPAYGQALRGFPGRSAAGRTRHHRSRRGHWPAGAGRPDRVRPHVGVAHSTGEEFDSSYDRGQPLDFGLGRGQVISGWDQGIQGMKVGGRRQLVIPPHLAYGPRGAGGVIGPNETLIFVCDLVAVR